jgi:Asp/Glu/hydantoin racemase
MKVGLVYTSTTKELIHMVEEEVRKNIDKDLELLSYQNSEILIKVREAGYVTKEAVVLLIDLYLQAINDGSEAILNVCSSVGETADAIQDFSKYVGVPIVRIDEDMCREAVRLGNRIGVLATLSTTLEPTKNTIKRVAREMGKNVEIVDGLIDGAFNIDQNQFIDLMLRKTGEISEQVDVILFAQGSMAYAEEHIRKAYGKPVLSSPKFGAIALKKALEQKGVL